MPWLEATWRGASRCGRVTRSASSRRPSTTWRESLQQAEALRRDMTADVAHELRNPLSVMQARVEAVIDGVYEPTPANLQPVLEQTRLLSRLVEDLRTLALADAGQLTLDRTEIGLRGAPRADGRRLSRPGTGGRRRAPPDDARGIRSANAGRSGPDRTGGGEPAGQRIAACAARHHGQRPARGQAGKARIEIADQGEGISSEALPFVFERFYRADRARSREHGGTGLGLAISRQIVQAHGGTIVAANGPEGGAAFTVELPASRTWRDARCSVDNRQGIQIVLTITHVWGYPRLLPDRAAMVAWKSPPGHRSRQHGFRAWVDEPKSWTSACAGGSLSSGE